MLSAQAHRAYLPPCLSGCCPLAAVCVHAALLGGGSHSDGCACPLICAPAQFDDSKDNAKDPKIVNMNIRQRVMKGARRRPAARQARARCGAASRIQCKRRLHAVQLVV